MKILGLLNTGWTLVWWTGTRVHVHGKDMGLMGGGEVMLRISLALEDMDDAGDSWPCTRRSSLC